MILKLNNNKEINIICTNGFPKSHQGTQRDCLEIHVAKDAISFDELDEMFTDSANTSKITLIDGENTHLHEDYTIRVGMELKPYVLESATTTTKAVTEERVIITMAQMTYIEKQLERLGV